MEKAPLDKLLPAGMSELRWRHLMDFFVEVKKPWVVGKTPGADRRIGEISAGYFEGERLRGTILTGGSDWQTDTPGVFVCGDAHRGASLVVWAIAEGRAAARGVDEFLMGESDLPSPVHPAALPLSVR